MRVLAVVTVDVTIAVDASVVTFAPDTTNVVLADVAEAMNTLLAVVVVVADTLLMVVVNATVALVMLVDVVNVAFDPAVTCEEIELHNTEVADDDMVQPTRVKPQLNSDPACRIYQGGHGSFTSVFQEEEEAIEKMAYRLHHLGHFFDFIRCHITSDICLFSPS
uniref:Uncharacterized protein n=1 Tax=Strigamia maritima TaxID=126957 RepID=T1JDR9_STRMM